MTTPPDPSSWPNPGTPPSGPPGYSAPGYGPPPPYGSPGGYGPPPQTWGAPGRAGGPAETDSKAIIALVLAIGSFLLIPLVPAIIALVLASSSRAEIAASGGRLSGDGLVTAAKVIAWLNIALCLVALLIVVVVFGAFLSIFDSVSDIPPMPVPG